MTNHESLVAVKERATLYSILNLANQRPCLYKSVWNNSLEKSKRNTQQLNSKRKAGKLKNFCSVFCLEKQENAERGITLIALVVTLVVLLILAGVTINLLFSDTGLFGKAQEAENAWRNGEQSDINAIGALGNQVNDILNGTGNQPEEILPSDGSYSETKGVNTPDLAGGLLTPIKWDETANSGVGDWVETTGDDEDWYNYTTTDKKWANAKISDGSMWVWIPRFAYQISDNYHTNSSTGGTINIQFMKGTGYESADGTKTQEGDWDNASGQGNWNIHPAFEYNGTKAGIWVAKFEASHTGCTTDITTGETNTNSTSLTLQIKPGVTSWRNITIGNMFTVCQNYRSDLNSHLMKNSEWGAIAYLTKSTYGKNSEVWPNNSDSYITGAVGNSSSSIEGEDTITDYKNAQQASTTGNIYGIYDLSGGAYEYVAAYINNSNASLQTYGGALVTSSQNMKDVYNYDSNNDNQTNNYMANANVYGDAIYETSSNSADPWNLGWYGDYTGFPYTDYPFLRRGGRNANGEVAGLFCFSNDNGNASALYGFRPVLVK